MTTINPIESLAQTIVDAASTISKVKTDSAQYDKSYPTQIVGVNRRFTKDVPVDKQTELISTYNIPETVTGDNYYTFVINGVYYCTQSNINFILYEKVVVRVPNGNWNRIFIEVGKAKGETSGVGQFTNAEKNSEIFNDYTRNRAYGFYQHVEGFNNVTAPSKMRSGDGAIHSGGATTVTFDSYLLSHLVNGKKYIVLLYVPASEFGEESLGANISSNVLAEFTFETGMTSVNVETTNAIATSWAVFDIGNFGGNHAGGVDNVNTGYYNTVNGTKNLTVNSMSSNVSGWGNRNDSQDCIMTGMYNYNGGSYGIVGGSNNTTKASSSVIAGVNNYILNGEGLIVGGVDQKIRRGNRSVVCGSQNDISAVDSIICGWGNTITDGRCGIVCGSGNTGIIQSGSIGLGLYGTLSTYKYITVGGGYDGSPSNILEFTTNGDMSISGNYNTMGADYAEYYEWEDKNANNEDRKCLFVTLDGDKIRVANDGDDYILGIVSVCPSIIGNSAEMEWSNKFLRNIYGEYERDEKGDRIVNPDYNPDNEYIPRSQRPEWVTIGTHGQLIVCDDGSCLVNSFCRVSKDGKATHSETKTDYRVIKRIDDTHVKVVLK